MQRYIVLPCSALQLSLPQVTYRRQKAYDVYERDATTALGASFKASLAVDKAIYRDFYDDLVESDKIVFLSSIQFAAQVLSIFTDIVVSEKIDRTYSFLFGDFWGDPRDADILFDLIVDLVNRGHRVYAMRNDINGTDRFQEHMASIRYNSTEWRRNVWLQQYWKNHFNCIDVPCNASQSLPLINRPILRNYKAPLVMDGISLISKFIRDYYGLHSFLPDSFHFSQFYQLGTVGNTAAIESNWTGNKLLFGQGGNKSLPFYWNQPVQWQYRIIGLESVNHTLHDWEYGIWTIGTIGLQESTGNLTVFNVATSCGPNNMARRSITPVQVDDACDPSKLHSMVGLLAVVLLLLITLSLIYIWIGGGVSKIKLVMRSPGRNIQIFLTVFSIIITFWIIYGDEALDCDNRVDDFLVNLANGVCFSLLLVYVCKRVEKEVRRGRDGDGAQEFGCFCFCIILPMYLCCEDAYAFYQRCQQLVGFLLLVVIQTVLAAGANSVGNETIAYCYAERGSLVVASYWFGCVLLLGFSYVLSRYTGG